MGEWTSAASLMVVLVKANSELGLGVGASDYITITTVRVLAKRSRGQLMVIQLSCGRTSCVY